MPTILVHGGAGRIKEARIAPHLEGCRAAADLGFERLAAGASALDAAIAAVRELEDRPAFNAGTGSALTREGTVETDAAVMEGHTRRAGAVALVTGVKNPIELARRVMETDTHVFLAGPEAERFADAEGIERCNPQSLVTEAMRAVWAKRESIHGVTGGTVGAVCLDDAGHLAAATSTGGTLGKWSGRIGDSPIVGAGTYANAGAALSATGDGEAILRACLARDVSTRLELGQAPLEAAEAGLAAVTDCGGEAGLILSLAGGGLLAVHTTPRMSRGWRTAEMKQAEAAVEGALSL